MIKLSPRVFKILSLHQSSFESQLHSDFVTRTSCNWKLWRLRRLSLESLTSLRQFFFFFFCCLFVTFLECVPKEIEFLVNRIIMSMLNVAIKATLRCTCRASAKPTNRPTNCYPHDWGIKLANKFVTLQRVQRGRACWGRGC